MLTSTNYKENSKSFSFPFLLNWHRYLNPSTCAIILTIKVVVVIYILYGGFNPVSDFIFGNSEIHIEQMKQNAQIIDQYLKTVTNIRPKITIDEKPPTSKNLGYQKLLEIVEGWSPDNPDPPVDFKETLKHFDYGNPQERLLAEKYRNAEIPFKLYNVSDFNEVSSLWTDSYLTHHL